MIMVVVMLDGLQPGLDLLGGRQGGGGRVGVEERDAVALEFRLCAGASEVGAGLGDERGVDGSHIVANVFGLGFGAQPGIVMLGGLIVAGVADGFLEQLIAFIAIAFGAINIVGGFMVTDRMLGMFSKKPKPKAEADKKGDS